MSESNLAVAEGLSAIAVDDSLKRNFVAFVNKSGLASITGEEDNAPTNNYFRYALNARDEMVIVFKATGFKWTLNPVSQSKEFPNSFIVVDNKGGKLYNVIFSDLVPTKLN